MTRKRFRKPSTANLMSLPQLECYHARAIDAVLCARMSRQAQPRREDPPVHETGAGAHQRFSATGLLWHANFELRGNRRRPGDGALADRFEVTGGPRASPHARCCGGTVSWLGLGGTSRCADQGRIAKRSDDVA